MSHLTLTDGTSNRGIGGMINGIGDSTLQNCIGWPYTQTYTYTAPIQIRAVNNGVIVTVGYIYNSTTQQGEYCFRDMKEAGEFIQSVLSQMVPK